LWWAIRRERETDAGACITQVGLAQRYPTDFTGTIAHARDIQFENVIWPEAEPNRRGSPKEWEKMRENLRL
jgi:hypothetical protein